LFIGRGFRFCASASRSGSGLGFCVLGSGLKVQSSGSGPRHTGAQQWAGSRKSRCRAGPLTHGEAEAHVDFKSPRRRVHHDPRGSEGIVRGELQLPVIPAPCRAVGSEQRGAHKRRAETPAGAGARTSRLRRACHQGPPAGSATRTCLVRSPQPAHLEATVAVQVSGRRASAGPRRHGRARVGRRQ
jgi:hypothetical protein